MAFVYTRKEYLINEKIILKDTKGEEIANFAVTLDDEELSFFRDLLTKASKDIEVVPQEEQRVLDIVFKNLGDQELTEYEKSQVVDYTIGKVVNKSGLDRMNTLNYATSTLQKKMKK